MKLIHRGELGIRLRKLLRFFVAIRRADPEFLSKKINLAVRTTIK